MADAGSLAIIPPLPEYDRRNETEHREQLKREMAKFFRKDADVIIPYGKTLGFIGQGGTDVRFKVTVDEEFAISINGATAFTLASSGDLDALEVSLTAAYQAADTTLSSTITAAYEAADDALEASLTLAVTAAYEAADASLYSSVTSEYTTAINTATGDLETSLTTTLTAAWQSDDSTQYSTITSEYEAAIIAGDTAVASQVTTLEAEVDGLSSSVTAVSTAVSTIEGYLSASYALTVDANGRIASMKLLSDGTTTEVAFTADTFKVYNGTDDEAVFEVSGGVVYVGGDRVRTESMAVNAVTLSATPYETDTAIDVDSSWTEVASISATAADAATLIKVDWSAYIESSGDGSLMEAQIKRGSTVVWGPVAIAGDPPAFEQTFTDEGDIYYAPTFAGMTSAFDMDTPGSAGSYTYKLELRVPGSVTTPWQASYRRMFAMAFKR